MYRLVLIRHGQSTWNEENKFTGWTDVELSQHGMKESHQAAHRLAQCRIGFDSAFVSVLRRAKQTLQIVLEDLGLTSIPVAESWRLNERHYGALQGMDKNDAAKIFGADQVYRWRRSYKDRPPALDPGDERNPANNPSYASVPKTALPLSESLQDTLKRVEPYWTDTIALEIKSGRKVLIVAHGNSLRALVKLMADISDENIVDYEIPTGVPLICSLTDALKAYPVAQA